MAQSLGTVFILLLLLLDAAQLDRHVRGRGSGGSFRHRHRHHQRAKNALNMRSDGQDFSQFLHDVEDEPINHTDKNNSGDPPASMLEITSAPVQITTEDDEEEEEDDFITESYETFEQPKVTQRRSVPPSTLSPAGKKFLEVLNKKKKYWLSLGSLLAVVGGVALYINYRNTTNLNQTKGPNDEDVIISTSASTQSIIFTALLVVLLVVLGGTGYYICCSHANEADGESVGGEEGGAGGLVGTVAGTTDYAGSLQTAEGALKHKSSSAKAAAIAMGGTGAAASGQPAGKSGGKVASKKSSKMPPSSSTASTVTSSTTPASTPFSSTAASPTTSSLSKGPPSAKVVAAVSEGKSKLLSSKLKSSKPAKGGNV
ncbi:hypothetical protein TYRP_007353 [Tyrophagus putrescentiae]|nr:hypothetical protein TYRP_007353 [Tyrophagus putrescentiae]